MSREAFTDQATARAHGAPLVERRLAEIDRAVEAFAPTATPETDAAWRLLKQPVGCPVGLSASPLTRSAKHIAYFAHHGFNILTCKTFRSMEWRPHQSPNWMYLANGDTPLALDANLRDLTVQGDPFARRPPTRPYSAANSYGVPSPPPKEWQKELADAREVLGSGQLLIASVQGSPEVYNERRTLVEDFIAAARLAAAAEPSAIELNLSCPNTVDFSGRAVRPPLCTSNPALTREIVVEVRDALPEATLIAKFSYLPATILGAFVASIATAVDAVAGINTLPARALTETGRPAFVGMDTDPAQARDIAGLSGAALSNFARDFVASLAALKDANSWDFDIIAMGGIMGARDTRALMENGANCVQVGTAALEGPVLAKELAAGVPLMA
jgi:dihydroorotate dehydrogenase